MTLPDPSHRRTLAGLALALTAALGLSACAPMAPTASTGATAAADTGYQPQRGQAGKDVMWIASPDGVVERMLQMGEVTAADRLVDLGSGDGKIVIAAARNIGTRSLGLEYNPQLVTLSIRRAQEAGVADRTSFREADIFVADFSDSTVVTMYLLPELNLRLRPQLFRMKPGTRIVSHSWRMGDWQPDETAKLGTAEIFLWRIPANLAGNWQVRAGAGLPQSLQVAQQFQRVTGTAAFGALEAGLADVRLAGDRLTFRLRDGSGGSLQVDARVAGDRLTGTATRADGSRSAFEATRSGAAGVIAGVEPTQAERNAAARALE